MENLGIDTTALSTRARSLSRAGDDSDDDMHASVLGKRRGRSRSRGGDDADRSAPRAQSVASATAATSMTRTVVPRSRSRAADAASPARSKSRPPSAGPPPGADGVRNVKQKLDIIKMAKAVQAKAFNLKGLKGESDRFIGTKMPKHLFSGKSGFQRDRR